MKSSSDRIGSTYCDRIEIKDEHEEIILWINTFDHNHPIRSLIKNHPIEGVIEKGRERDQIHILIKKLKCEFSPNI